MRFAGKSFELWQIKYLKPLSPSMASIHACITDELLKLMDTEVGRKAIENTVGLFGAAKNMIKTEECCQTDQQTGDYRNPTRHAGSRSRPCDLTALQIIG
jgi:hypothetical protein